MTSVVVSGRYDNRVLIGVDSWFIEYGPSIISCKFNLMKARIMWIIGRREAVNSNDLDESARGPL
jgi:hypothetical protein